MSVMLVLAAVLVPAARHLPAQGLSAQQSPPPQGSAGRTVYQFDIGASGLWEEDRQWQAGVDGMYSFQPLRHDARHATEAAKRLQPHSWIAIGGLYGPIPEYARENTDAWGLRVAGAAMLGRALRLGGVFTHEESIFDTGDAQQREEDRMTRAGVFLGVIASPSVYLRETVGLGRRGSYFRYLNFENDEASDSWYFEHHLDVLAGAGAYSHTLRLEVEEGAYAWFDFTHVYEIARGASFTVAPLLSYHGQGGTNALGGAYLTYAVAFRWYPVPRMLVALQPAFHDDLNHARNDRWLLGAEVRVRR